jgi:tetratricopeptide (TPR) repeat protein
MAIKVQKIFETKQANKIFTDRDEPRKAFWDKYSQYKENKEKNIENDITILTYYGIGGIGKSTLLHKLQDELEEYRSKINDIIPHVYYDMKTDNSKKAILEGLREILIKKYNFKFPVFELALNVYRVKIGKDTNVDKHDGIISSNQYAGVATDIASAGVDLLNVVPLAGPVVAGTLKTIDHLIATIRNKHTNRKIELSHLQNDSPEDILKNLQLNFAKDLADNLNNVKYPLVIFFDTYEMLVNELASVGEPLLNDAWLRDINNGLVTHTPNLIWVFAGREKIKWDQINPEWKDNFEQHLIGDLSEADTRKFLSETGITDLSFQDQIYEITKGTPVYLDICVNNYFYLVNNNLEITIKSLGDDQKELVNRFMVYTDGSQKDILYIMSCLDTWTEDYLIEIARKNSYSISVTTLKAIEGLSFIEANDGINYRMHQLVKEILYNQCNFDIKRRILSYDSNYNREKLNHIDTTSDDFTKTLKKYINGKMEQSLTIEDNDKFFLELKDTYIKCLVDTFQYDDTCQVYELLLRYASPDKFSPLVEADIYMYYSKVLMKAGKYSNMVAYAKEALEMYIRLLGNEHPNTLVAMNNLSLCYRDVGRLQEAVTLSEEVYELRKRILGDEHPHTLSSMNNLSACYSDVGRNREALVLTEKVMELSKQILGGEHPNTLMIMSNLSNRYNDVGRNREALELAEKVLELRRRILGDEHPDTLMTMSNLSNRYNDVGRKQEALELAEKVLELSKRILGDEHPDTLMNMNNLSNRYYNVGRNREALELAEKVLELDKRILGDEHPGTLLTMYNLSNRYSDVGRNSEAIELAEKVLELDKRIFGEEHPETLIAMNYLSNQYYDVGRIREALELEEKVLELRKRVLGDEHPDTLTAMNNLSNRYNDVGRNREALELGEKVSELKKRALGEGYFSTSSALTDLTRGYSDEEILHETQKLMEKLNELMKKH